MLGFGAVVIGIFAVVLSSILAVQFYYSKGPLSRALAWMLWGESALTAAVTFFAYAETSGHINWLNNDWSQAVRIVAVVLASITSIHLWCAIRRL